MTFNCAHLIDNGYRDIPKTMGIYAIKNTLNNKVYIGSALSFNRRFCHHVNRLQANQHDNRFLQNSWNKNGFSRFEISILESVKEISELPQREKSWIELTKSANGFGYNIQKDGRTWRNSTFSKKHKENLSNSLKGHAVSDLTKKAVSKTRVNDWQERLRKFKSGELNASDLKTPFKPKSVYQFDINGNFIAEWKTIADASRIYSTSKNSSDISRVCRGKRKFAFGYLWSFQRAGENIGEKPERCTQP